MLITDDKMGNFKEMNEEFFWDIIEEYLCLKRAGMEPDIAEYIEKIRSTADTPEAEDLMILAHRLETASEQFRTNLTSRQIEQSYQQCRETLLNAALEAIKDPT
ncbi:MAG: hypothetical protein OEV87_10080 [Phycisphaerae bacterium]|nr:hypothetical protein [Phycisphaerae bacterium]